MPSSTASKVTTDHDEIRRWATERGARPVAVKRAGRNGDGNVIGFIFARLSGKNHLKEVSWEEWLQKFDEHKLSFLYQEKIANGQRSNYNEIVSRGIVDEVESAVGGRGRSASVKGSIPRNKKALPRGR
jgi:hypothetical protein